jgi:hypothetical protein
MSDHDMRGELFIAGVAGEILSVGGRAVNADVPGVQQRSGAGDYPTPEEFWAGHRAEEARLAADKRKLKELTKRRRAIQGYAERLVERERRLFEREEDNRDQFPPPSQVIRKGRQS